MWLDVHVSLALLFVVACGRERSPPWLRTLSDATFAIYLFQLFFVYGAEMLLRPESRAFEPAVIGARGGPAPSP